MSVKQLDFKTRDKLLQLYKTKMHRKMTRSPHKESSSQCTKSRNILFCKITEKKKKKTVGPISRLEQWCKYRLNQTVLFGDSVLGAWSRFSRTLVPAESELVTPSFSVHQSSALEANRPAATTSLELPAGRAEESSILSNTSLRCSSNSFNCASSCC